MKCLIIAYMLVCFFVFGCQERDRPKLVSKKQICINKCIKEMVGANASAFVGAAVAINASDGSRFKEVCDYCEDYYKTMDCCRLMHTYYGGCFEEDGEYKMDWQ